MSKFKEAPRSDLAPTPHKSVEEFIASAPVQTVTKKKRAWELFDPNEEPGHFFQLRINTYQHALLAAVAKRNSRSMHSEVIHTLMRSLEEVAKELP